MSVTRNCDGSGWSISTHASTLATLPVKPEMVVVAMATEAPSGIAVETPVTEEQVPAAICTAASVSTRGDTTPLRESVIGFPVARRTPAIPAGVRSGRAWWTRAAAPATAGHDAEVP